MRNNNNLFDSVRKQFEDSPQDDGVVVQQAQTKTSFLDFINPTELVTLPSKGIFYDQNHPLFQEETIEIKQMTAKEEDILTNKSFIKKGIVFEKLIEALIVDKRIKPDDLYVGDKNAILLVSRISAYGSDYHYEIQCPNCNTKSKKITNLIDCINYTLDDIDSDNSTAKDIGYKRQPNGNILITLPRTKWIVECKLLTGRDEKQLQQLSESKRKFTKDTETTFTDILSAIIVKIEGEEDRTIISKAVEVMPASDSLYLKKVYELLTPNVKLNTEFECYSCGHTQETEVPITQEFFWPNQ